MTALTYNKFVKEEEINIVYAFIEALADGRVLKGMPRDKAYQFAAQAVLGGAEQKWFWKVACIRDS